jgi:hypothetical protein
MKSKNFLFLSLFFLALGTLATDGPVTELLKPEAHVLPGFLPTPPTTLTSAKESSEPFNGSKRNRKLSIMTSIIKYGTPIMAGGMGGFLFSRSKTTSLGKKLQILRNKKMNLTVKEMELPRSNNKLRRIVNNLNEAKSVVDATSNALKSDLQQAIGLF